MKKFNLKLNKCCLTIKYSLDNINLLTIGATIKNNKKEEESLKRNIRIKQESFDIFENNFRIDCN